MNVLKNAHFAISGEETINFIDSGYKAVRWPWVEIETDAEVVVKLSEDTPDENAWIVKSHAVIPCGVSTIYISGSANVQIVGLSAPLESSFKSSGKGGESWVSATGNPVTLKGLQGGVPFNSVIVSGDDIIGKEIMLTVTGKNVIQYPYFDGASKSDYGVDFAVDDEGRVNVSGQLSGNTYAIYALKPRNTWYHLPVGKYTLVGGKNETRYIQINGTRNGSAYLLAKDTGNGFDFEITDDSAIGVNLFITDYEPVNEIFEPMVIYRGCDKKYEKYSGQEEYTITPDTNPYTVPIDITQVDGTNVITADNEAVISVNANRKNPQIAKIYEKIDELTTALIVGLGGIE